MDTKSIRCDSCSWNSPRWAAPALIMNWRYVTGPIVFIDCIEWQWQWFGLVRYFWHGFDFVGWLFCAWNENKVVVDEIVLMRSVYGHMNKWNSRMKLVSIHESISNWQFSQALLTNVKSNKIFFCFYLNAIPILLYIFFPKIRNNSLLSILAYVKYCSHSAQCYRRLNTHFVRIPYFRLPDKCFSNSKWYFQ